MAYKDLLELGSSPTPPDQELPPADVREREVDALMPTRDMTIQEKLARINALNASEHRGRRRLPQAIQDSVDALDDPLNAFDHKDRQTGLQGTRAILADFAETFKGDPDAEELVSDIAKRRKSS